MELRIVKYEMFACKGVFPFVFNDVSPLNLLKNVFRFLTVDTYGSVAEVAKLAK